MDADVSQDWICYSIRRRRDGERKKKQARTGVDEWPALRVLSDATQQGLFCVRWPTRAREV
ncbi:hypothetical protein PspLS_00329 [Pyricularia sp. CBS 133598]|nr:hypothetical protein PspLS_00329 [Pyricularia sp. CBS 133598]